MDLLNKIASYSSTRALLERYGLRARKSLGQNFLIDTHVLEKIIGAAEIGPHDFILEIGPGLGGLTQALAEKAGQVCAVELDAGFVRILNETFCAETPNVEIVHQDIMDFDIHKCLQRFPNMNHKVVANLPYYITTPVVMHLLENYSFKSITVMVQQEVAERMVSRPGSAAYGALSLAVQYHANVSIAAYVPENCFFPRPKVGSAVVFMDILTQPQFKADKTALFAIIKAGFGHRRKTLVNSLFSAELYPLTKEKIAEVLTGLDKNPSVRGEELALEDWARLVEALEKASEKA